MLPPHIIFIFTLRGKKIENSFTMKSFLVYTLTLRINEQQFKQTSLYEGNRENQRVKFPFSGLIILHFSLQSPHNSCCFAILIHSGFFLQPHFNHYSFRFFAIFSVYARLVIFFSLFIFLFSCLMSRLRDGHFVRILKCN